jgi:hypothetical protein
MKREYFTGEPEVGKRVRAVREFSGIPLVDSPGRDEYARFFT